MPFVYMTRHIEKKLDDTGYLGHIKILECELNYALSLPYGVAWLQGIDLPSVEEVRRSFVISVLNGTKPVPLADDEYVAFYALLSDFLVNFEQAPHSTPPHGLLKKLLETIGGQFAGSTTEYGRYELAHSVYDVFLREKFRKS